ncbi:MAG: S8 family peptidase, partial [Anaerolineales bacterium]
MQTNLSLARKILSGLVLLVLFLGTFSTGNLPSARAQEAATVTPIPPVIPTERKDSSLRSITAPSDRIPSRVVIQFAAGTSEAEKDAYVRALGGVIVKRIKPLNTYVVLILDNPSRHSRESVPNAEIVESTEPDYVIAALDDAAPVNDPRYAEQWALPAIGAPDAWAQLPPGAAKVTVAVIDSGICASHPDLTGRIVEGWDFLESDAVPQDDFGHGCSVSGVIAANMNDGIGIAGVAPNAQVMPLRVLNASGVGSYSDVAAAIVYAADNGAQVINLSLGGPNPSSMLENAVNYAIAKGVIVVAAAGNSGTEGALYPAAYPDVIAVGSVDPSLQHSNFSNYGSQIDIWAPGRDILTTKWDGSYGLVSGTSFAAPFVAGATAIKIITGEPLLLEGQIVNVVVSKELEPPTQTPVGNIVTGPAASGICGNDDANPADRSMTPFLSFPIQGQSHITVVNNREITSFFDHTYPLGYPRGGQSPEHGAAYASIWGRRDGYVVVSTGDHGYRACKEGDSQASSTPTYPSLGPHWSQTLGEWLYYD